jgi:ABC-type glycerol-3-phosphate transport system permease component
MSSVATLDRRTAAQERAALRARLLWKGLAYLVLLIVLVIAVVPFFWSVLGSLKTTFELFEQPFALPRTPRWNNYAVAWTEGKFSLYFINSTIIALPSVLLTLACGALAGYAFGRLRFAGSNVLFYTFLVGIGIPANALVVPLFATVKNLGLLNTYAGVVLPSVGASMPFAIFLMRAFFRSLPGELADAARVDGCTTFGVFWRIMLPLAQAPLLSLMLFTFMDSWNGFLYPLLFLQEESMRTIPLGLLVFQGRYLTEFSLLFAGLVISFIPTLVLYFLFQRQFIQGITVGSIQG